MQRLLAVGKPSKYYFFLFIFIYFPAMLLGCARTAKTPSTASEIVRRRREEREKKVVEKPSPKAAEAQPAKQVTATESQPPDPITLGFLNEEGYQIVPVMVYHDINKDAQRSTDVSVNDFYEQMQYLYDNGYATITAQEFYDSLTLKAKIPAKSVILTFDDGYKSISNEVYNILKKFNFHAVLFIYTDAIVNHYGAYMTWDEIKQVSQDVFEIQAHSKTHAADIPWQRPEETEKEYLDRLDKELLFPKKILEEKTGKPVEFLAYPYGSYSDQLINLLRDKYKYKGAFTVIGAGVGEGADSKDTVAFGSNSFFTDPFKIRRIQILKKTSFSDFIKCLQLFKQEDVFDGKTLEKFEAEISKLK